MEKKSHPESLNGIAQAIFDKKGKNILALDVREVSQLTDYVIIAEGNVNRHVQAIAREVSRTPFEEEEFPAFIEGEGDGEWIVLDYINVMVHIFTPEVRKYYALEELWRDGKIIDLEIEFSNIAQGQ